MSAFHPKQSWKPRLPDDVGDELDDDDRGTGQLHRRLDEPQVAPHELPIIHRSMVPGRLSAFRLERTIGYGAEPGGRRGRRPVAAQPTSPMSASRIAARRKRSNDEPGGRRDSL